MNEKGAKSPPFFRLSVAVLVLCAPLALLAAFSLPNEYAGQGVEGAVDCDGPLGVMIFAIPGYLIYGIGAACFGTLPARKARWPYGIVALLCAAVVAFMTPNVIDAYREHSSPLHKESCGEGW